MTAQQLRLVAETPRGMVLATLVEASGPWLYLELVSPLLGPGPAIELSARVRELGPAGPSRLLVHRSCEAALELLWPDGGLHRDELSMAEAFHGTRTTRASRNAALLEGLRRGLKARRGH